MKRQYLIDYLSFTIFEELDVIFILKELEFLYPFRELNRGNFGYTKALAYKNILVYFEGTENMGIHFQLSGKALNMLRGTITYDNLFTNIKKFKYKISRIDLTLDVINFDILNKVKFALQLNNIRTRFKTFTKIETTKIKNMERLGETIYFGSRTSNIFIRFYDKAKEKKEKEKDITRIEIELKNKSATKIFNQLDTHFLTNNLIQIVNGLLKNNINFIDINSDNNKSRCKTLDWWNDVISYDTTDIITSGISYAEKSITESREWLEKSVARTFAKVLYTDSDFVKILSDIGTEKLDEKDTEDISNYITNMMEIEQLQNNIN